MHPRQPSARFMTTTTPNCVNFWKAWTRFLLSCRMLPPAQTLCIQRYVFVTAFFCQMKKRYEVYACWQSHIKYKNDNWSKTNVISFFLFNPFKRVYVHKQGGNI